MRDVFVNGDFFTEDKANISVFDRGFLFADAVYEVIAVLDGKLVDFEGHVQRLFHSLSELDMKCDMDRDALLEMNRELVRRNDVEEGLVYLQVTRGAADREFAFPDDKTPSTIVAFTQEKAVASSEKSDAGIKIIFAEDQRWGRCDIKTVQLLYASLAKMEAKKQGADDAWLTSEGNITEGTSNNAYIVTKEGVIVTRDLGHEILGGITRKAVLACARNLQMKVEERPFSIQEARDAKEAFVTASTSFVLPVVQIDGQPVGPGTPGAVAKKLREIYLADARKSAI